MIVYRKSRLTIAEFYYEEEARPAPADVIRYYCRPFGPAGVPPQRRWVVNLEDTPERLLGQMKHQTRGQIRKAARDGLVEQHWVGPDPAILVEFYEFYDRFAATKQLWKLNRSQMASMAEAGCLSLSSMSAAGGESLVWHAHYFDGRGVLAMVSAALFRDPRYAEMASLIGRANRLLHWQDILRFRESGAQLYDFGGSYEGSDASQLSINQFKAGFGASLEPFYCWDEARTVRGGLGLRARALVAFWRERRARLAAARN